MMAGVVEIASILLVQIPLDRLLRCLLKFLLQYLYFCYLGVCRQNVVQFQPVLFHYVLEVVKKVVEEITTEKKDTSMEKFLTVNEVVSNLGVSRTTLWRWEKYNYLTPIRVGTKVLYREAEIKKLLNN